MLRKFVFALFALALCVTVSLAAEVKGTLKSVNADKGTLLVVVGDQEHTFTITESTRVVGAQGDLKDGLKDRHFKEGAPVTITTEEKDGKDVVTEVKVESVKKADR